MMDSADHRDRPRSATTTILELQGISKSYSGFPALQDVDFSLRQGEVHALFGENGAGKSTLISIIAGVQQPTSGQILLNGAQEKFATVREARNKGICSVFQEFSLVPSLSVAANIALGEETTQRGFLNRRIDQAQAEAALKRLGFPIDARRQTSGLSRAEQQMVEIAKAIRSNLSILILDEPTASLTDKEAEQLFDVMRQLTAKGIAIIYISHRMQEVRRVADRVTVLRDGRIVGTVDAEQSTDDALIRMMTGREVGQIYPTIAWKPGVERLSLRGLTTVTRSIKDIELHARAGEVVGLAGLVGSGKSKAIRAAFGLEPIACGQVLLDGKAISRRSVKDTIESGMLYVTSDRRGEGLILARSCIENIALPSVDRKPFSSFGFLRWAGKAKARQLATEIQLSPMRPDTEVVKFSGGNQQKVMLARTMTRPLKIIALDEPTVGVDVRTRAAIYDLVRHLCESGVAVVLISSDLPEVINLSHRMYVFSGGRVVAELNKEEISEEVVLGHFFNLDGRGKHDRH